MAAIAAVDMALWDIKAKAANCHCTSCWVANAAKGRWSIAMPTANSIEETLEKAQGYIAQGYKAVRLQAGVPGLKSTYGVSKKDQSLRNRPTPIFLPNMFGPARNICAPCLAFLRRRGCLGLGCASAARRPSPLDPIEAARLGKDLEPYRLFWLEDAVPAENRSNFRLIRQHTTTPWR